jgi:hypothetical protein
VLRLVILYGDIVYGDIVFWVPGHGSGTKYVPSL